jgi:hypothetical protein
LKLLDRALATPEFSRDLAQTLLADEASDDHLPLIGWERVDELVKHDPPLDIVFHADLFQIVGRDFLLLGGPLPAIRKYVCCNPQEPCRERQAAPLEPRKAGQGLVEDLRRQILRLFAVSHAMRDVGVDSFKIVFVQLGKARRILPRRLDLQPLIVVSEK